MASSETLYICKITFIRVTSVPVADLHNLSCDPYLQATLSTNTSAQRSNDVPATLTYRTHTCRQSLDPEFNDTWIASGIPESGFLLSIRLRDEDPGNYDDHLGKTVLRMPNEGEGRLQEGWKSGDREYKVKKRKGSVTSQLFTCTARIISRGDIGHHVRLWVHAEVLGKAANQDDKRMYTVGPRKYVRHFSPLIGRFLGSSNSPDGNRNETKVKPTAFIANRIQLAGPIPSTLRHRYVGFAPFVKAMFRRTGIRGMVLHHALHKQHLSIYKWDKNVVWGVIGDDEKEPEGEERQRVQDGENEKSDSHLAQEHGEIASDSIAMARQFLRMTSHGTKGRMFTYVIMLDGELRFTETGEQITVQFLSKHTMHSDVAVEIAFSGEFFIRPLRRHRTAVENPSSAEHPDDEHPSPEDFDDDNPPDDPGLYELVIDNDSGTYRPSKDLLPTLHSYLASPRNFGALGRVTAIQAFDDRLKRWKEERKKAKQGEQIIQTGSMSSMASSSSSSVSDVSGAEGVTTGDMRAVVEEDAKRARENQDEDPEAKVEESEAPAEGSAKPKEQS